MTTPSRSMFGAGSRKARIALVAAVLGATGATSVAAPPASAATYYRAGAFGGLDIGTQADRSLFVATETTSPTGVVQAALQSAKVVAAAQAPWSLFQIQTQVITLTITLEEKTDLPDVPGDTLFWQPVAQDVRRATIVPPEEPGFGMATFPRTTLTAPGPAPDNWTMYRLVYDLTWVNADDADRVVSTVKVVPDQGGDAECATFALECIEGGAGLVSLRWPPLRPR